MKMTNDRYEDLLRQVARDCQRILGDNLWGIYLHGSLAFGCFHPEHSDIDFLVVVEQPLSLGEKEALLRTLLEREAEAPPKGFEMSVVLLRHCRQFCYPTPFELHYSIFHRQRYVADPRAFCEAMHGEDPDLAAHFTVVRAVGQVLCGRPVEETFDEVPREAYLDSIRADVAQAEQDVLRDPVYILLNLCRVLAFQEEGLVLSKEQGGEWGLKALPAVAAMAVEQALCAYREGGDISAGEEALLNCCAYIKGRLGS